MGRELRKVPANWEHPIKSDGRPQPMFKKYYGDALNEWLKEHEEWENGTHSDLNNRPELKEEYPFYAMWGGNPPDVDYYQPRKYSEKELTHIQLYESTSEGTPISPVFPADKIEELCEYAAENCSTFGSFKTTKEKWMEMLKDDFVVHRQGNIIFM